MTKIYTQADLEQAKRKSYDAGVKDGLSTAQVMSTAERRAAKTSSESSVNPTAIYAARRNQPGRGQ